MDVSEYMPMFLAECREHLQQLNLAVVEVERASDDAAAIDDIFRIAHSLKGMSATMGFGGIAALTHEMEDVFELLRRRSGGLGREAADVLLECLDALTAAVEAIEAEGEERLDPGALVGRLRGLVRAEDEAGLGTGPRPEEIEGAAVPAAVRLTARLVADAAMPGVRAFQVLAALAGAASVVRSEPDEAGLEGFAGREVVAWLATGCDEAAAAAAAAGVADVEAVAVEPVADERPVGSRAVAGSGTRTVRVDAERLDQLMHLMGELVVSRTRVESLAAGSEVPGLARALQDLARSSQALQTMVMQARMVPVEAVLVRFPRLVRDLSARLGKKVELVLSGRETELDRTVVDALGDPLVHLVRNALDHGLEPPGERAAAGKPETGRIEIEACHQGGSIVVVVRDDGRGVDPARIAARAVERGLLAPGAAGAVDASAAAELLFAPGFSTAEETSDVSGRGVGMDAVRAAVRGLGGEVWLSSETGAGTAAHMRLPLTLAIVSALLVEARRMPFAVPLERVERTLRLSDHPIRSLAGRRLLVLADGVVPLACAAGALGHEPAPEPSHAVVVRAGQQRLALAVERLVGQYELVTRPLPASVAEGAALSGGAVLPDGRIALIVDCDALARGAGASLTVAA